MLRRLARAVLRISGWTIVGETPEVEKAVIIAAPHTSNWDAFWALSYKVATGIDVHFFGKHTLFWFPLGNLLRALGGIPLDRGNASLAVAQTTAAFRDNASYYFGLAPEGTRSRRPGWKSGFYRIAMEARVPVILGFLDYRNKRVGLGPAVHLSGDMTNDLARIRDFYSGIEGRWPENTSPIRFPPES
jgi:1-acyl-sn-glycerol-3-phosphate acyltransferase